jgi:hypothetical protein
VCRWNRNRTLLEGMRCGGKNRMKRERNLRRCKEQKEQRKECRFRRMTGGKRKNLKGKGKS